MVDDGWEYKRKYSERRALTRQRLLAERENAAEKKCCPCWKTTGQAVVSENSNRWIEKARQWRRAMREGFARRTKGAAVSEKWKTMFNWYYNPKLQRRSFGSPTCLLFGRRLFQPTLRRAWSFSKISVLKRRRFII